MAGRDRSMKLVGGAGAGLVAGVGSVLAMLAGMSCASKPGGNTLEGDRGPDGAITLPATGTPTEMNAAGMVNTGPVMPSLGAGGAPTFGEAMAIAGRSPTDLTGADACGQVTAETEPKTVETVVETEITTNMPAPVAIYFVLDNSMSMNDEGDDGITRWDEAVAAITAFVNDAGSAGLSATIQYFTPPEADGADVCDGAFQAAPAAPMDLLPANAQPIIDSMAATPLIQSTPTTGALTGGIDYCVQYEIDNPDTQCIVLLITDGVPSACGLSSACTGNNPGGGAGGAGTGGAGAGGAPPINPGGGECVDPEAEGILVPIATEGSIAGVSTFAVGMEGVPIAGFAMLDAIAIAGGTDCTPGTAGAEACNVTTTGPAGFLEAFNVIRETISMTELVKEVVTETVIEKLECEWLIPPPVDPDEPIEFNLVNLQLTIPGSDPTPIGSVPTAADCANAAGGVGWHYDNPTTPTSIIACPNTCTTIQEAEMPVVNILLGCETEPAKLD